MGKRTFLLCIVFLLGASLVGCSKPPYDAKAIDESELDPPSKQERSTPPAGGGQAINESQW